MLQHKDGVLGHTLDGKATATATATTVAALSRSRHGAATALPALPSPAPARPRVSPARPGGGGSGGGGSGRRSMGGIARRHGGAAVGGSPASRPHTMPEGSEPTPRASARASTPSRRLRVPAKAGPRVHTTLASATASRVLQPRIQVAQATGGADSAAGSSKKAVGGAEGGTKRRKSALKRSSGAKRARKKPLTEVQSEDVTTLGGLLNTCFKPCNEATYL